MIARNIMFNKYWMILSLLLLFLLAACSNVPQSLTETQSMPAEIVVQSTLAPENLTTQTNPEIDIFAFEIVDAKGNLFDLTAYQGKPLMLIFFSTQCSHCRHEAEHLEALYSQNQDQMNIVALEVSGATDDDITQFATEYDLSFPISSDTTKELTQTLGITGVPTNILLNSDGSIYDTIRGYHEQAVFQTSIDALLLENSN